MKTVIDKLYIIHPPIFKDREVGLNKQLPQLNMDPNNVEWRFNYYRDNIPEDVKNKFYKQDIVAHEMKKKFGHYSSSVWANLDVPGLRLFIAVLIEHGLIYEKMIKENIQTAMVVEDDVLFGPNFSNNLVHYMKQLPADWDIFYPGSICNAVGPNGIILPEYHNTLAHIQNIDPNKNVYLQPSKMTRGAYVYILKLETAKKIISKLPFTLPIDFELIAQHWINNLNVYWGEPTLTLQGSEVGPYKSTVR